MTVDRGVQVDDDMTDEELADRIAALEDEMLLRAGLPELERRAQQIAELIAEKGARA